MQDHKLLPQPVATLWAIRIFDNRVIDWANLLTGWRIVVTDALRTAVHIDLIDAVAHRNRLIRALRLAHIAINTAPGDQ